MKIYFPEAPTGDISANMVKTTSPLKCQQFMKIIFCKRFSESITNLWSHDDTSMHSNIHVISGLHPHLITQFFTSHPFICMSTFPVLFTSVYQQHPS